MTSQLHHFANEIEIEIVYFYSHHMKLNGLDVRTWNAKKLNHIKVHLMMQRKGT